MKAFLKFGLILFFIVCIIPSNAQTRNTATLRDAQNYLNLFFKAFDNKEYTSAIYDYEKAIALDSNISFPYFIKYLSCYASIGNYQKVVEQLQPFIEKNQLPSYLKDKALLLFESANFAVENQVNLSSNEIKVNNLGDSINSEFAEYFPIIGSKDSLFVFVRKINGNKEDFFESKYKNGSFTRATKLEGAINQANKKGGASFSKDFHTIYFAAEYPNGVKFSYGRFDIYKSIWDGKTWSEPMNMGSQINTDFWESAPSISADGKSLYFCSNRPDGYGGIDIYVAHKNEKGYWEPAVNLGPTINTPGDEQTPVIFSDNHTLYFSSNGIIGYGGADLFMSTLDKQGNWSTPINLGYPINSYDNEGSIAIAPNGKAAYIASDRKDSRGTLDIYQIDLPIAVQPKIPLDTLAQIPKKDSIAFVVEKPINFKQLSFASNSAAIQKESFDELMQLAHFLKNHPSYRILIEGHTDNSGVEKKNSSLSLKRAVAVKQFLISQEIQANRILTKGWGATKPLVSNVTLAGRAQNRRTTFTILTSK